MSKAFPAGRKRRRLDDDLGEQSAYMSPRLDNGESGYRGRGRSPVRGKSTRRFPLRSPRRHNSKSPPRSSPRSPQRHSSRSPHRSYADSNLDKHPPPTRPSKPANPAMKPTSPTKPKEPLESTVDQEDAESQIRNFYTSLVQGAATLGSLNNQKDAAQLEVDRTKADYEKSRNIHSKFPATEESQRKNLERASRKQKSINEKISYKQDQFQKIVSQNLSTLVPSLAQCASFGPRQDPRTDTLVDKLQQLTDLVEAQSTALKAQEVTMVQEREARKSAEEQAKKDRDSFEARLNKLAEQHANNAAIGKLEEDVKVTADATRFKLATLEKNLQAIQQETVKLPAFNEHRQELDRLKKGVDAVTAQVKNQNLPSLKKHDERLKILEETRINSLSVITDLDTQVKGLISKVETSEPPQAIAPSKLEALEKLPGIIQSVEAMDKDLAALNKMGIAACQESLRSRLSALESRSQQQPQELPSPVSSLSAAVSIEVSRLIATEIVKAKEEVNEIVQNSMLASDNAAMEFFGKLDNRCTALERGQASQADSSVDTIKRDINSIKEDLEAQRGDIKALLTDLNNAKRNLVSIAVQKTIEAFQQDPTLLPMAYLQNLVQTEAIKATMSEFTSAIKGVEENVRTLQTGQNGLSASVNGALFRCSNIEKRLQNINTSDMAQFMISQLENVYPRFRNAENLLQAHANSITALQAQGAQIAGNTTSITALTDQIGHLETARANFETKLQDALENQHYQSGQLVYLVAAKTNFETKLKDTFEKQQCQDSQLKEMSDSITELTSKTIAIETTANKANASNEALVEAKVQAALNTQLPGTEDSIIALAKEIPSLLKRSNDLLNLVSINGVRLSSLEEQTRTNSNLEDRTSKLESHVDSIATMSSRIDTLEKRIETLSADRQVLESLREDIRKAQDSITCQSTGHSDEIAKWVGHIKLLQSNITSKWEANVTNILASIKSVKEDLKGKISSVETLVKDSASIKATEALEKRIDDLSKLWPPQDDQDDQTTVQTSEASSKFESDVKDELEELKGRLYAVEIKASDLKLDNDLLKKHGDSLFELQTHFRALSSQVQNIQKESTPTGSFASRGREPSSSQHTPAPKLHRVIPSKGSAPLTVQKSTATPSGVPAKTEARRSSHGGSKKRVASNGPLRGSNGSNGRINNGVHGANIAKKQKFSQTPIVVSDDEEVRDLPTHQTGTRCDDSD